MATAIPDIEILRKKQKANDEVNWVTAIFMGLFHVGAIAALFFFSWKRSYWSRRFFGGSRRASGSAFATTACSRTAAIRLRNGLNIS